MSETRSSAVRFTARHGKQTLQHARPRRLRMRSALAVLSCTITLSSAQATETHTRRQPLNGLPFAALVRAGTHIVAMEGGATKSLVTIQKVERDQLNQTHLNEIHRARYVSRDFSGPHAILTTFLGDLKWPEGAPPRVDAIVVDVPGPVTGDRVVITNLPWDFGQRELETATRNTMQQAGIMGDPELHVINDMDANGKGLWVEQGSDGLHTIQPGRGERPANGRIVMVSAGSGLGTGAQNRDGRRIIHHQGAEGQHALLAPLPGYETQVRDAVADRTGGFVAWEDLVSGPGIVLLHDAIATLESQQVSFPVQEAQRRAAEREKVDVSAVVVEQAQEGDPIATAAIAQFTQFLAGAAQATALHYLPIGGVYLGGGIAPKLHKAGLFDGRSFAERFTQTGRQNITDLLEDAPVYIVMDEDTALKGAVIHGLQSLAYPAN